MAGGFHQLFGTANLPVTTGAMPYQFTPNYFIRAAYLNTLRNQIPFMSSPWKLPEMDFFNQTSQNGYFPPTTLQNDEPPRKHSRLTCDSQCPICGELTVTQQDLNDHFVEESKQIEETFQSFKTKIASEKQNQQYYVDYACENRYKILNDAKLHKSDRRQKKCIPFVKQYTSSLSIRSKSGDDAEDDDDLDVASCDPNDNGSCISSPRQTDFDVIDKRNEKSPLPNETRDCHCCGKSALEAFVSPKCRHFLCLGCFDEYLQKTKSCPVCKFDLTDDSATETNDKS